MTVGWSTFEAMGTTVRVYPGDAENVEAVSNVFAGAEQSFSRFRSDSELSRTNANDEDVALSGPLLEVLRVAQDLRDRTDGLVDVGIGERMVAWGYNRTFDAIAGPSELPSQGGAYGWRLDGDRLIRTPGTVIDLGGIAKGWTADLAVAITDAWVVSAGGDIRSLHPETAVDVRDPVLGTIGRVHVGDAAIATSTTAKRTWSVGDHVAHHIIDPRTGDPVQSPVRTAAALAPTAVEAEAAAKVILLKGVDGLSWAEAQPWVMGGLAVFHDGSVYASRGLDARTPAHL